MKTELTIEQSAELIKHGIHPDDNASSEAYAVDENGKNIDLFREHKDYKLKWYEWKETDETTGWGDPTGSVLTPIFTIGDLLSILPQAHRDLGGLMVGFHVERGNWRAFYDDNSYRADADEMIDALYELLLWVIDNKYLKV